MHCTQSEQQQFSSVSGMARMTVYIVEDDENLVQLLMKYLCKFGLNVCVVQDFDNIDGEVRQNIPHLIVLDVNLPGYDGFYWCRTIRCFSMVPIIFLSARCGNLDMISALERGGDDYITKPFHAEVFIAKVRALLRRTYGDYLGDSHAHPNTVVKNGIILDIRRREVIWHGKIQPLTMTELWLLRILLEAYGKPVARNELLSAIWDNTDFVDDNTLTVNITRLKNKLSCVGLSNSILTVRGVGYRFTLRNIR